MADELLLTSEAEVDLHEAYDWYEGCRAGLGEEFLSCVDASIEVIKRAPQLHAKVLADYRRVLIRRFPFAIFYDYGNGTVTVYAVFHTSQDPQKWRKRPEENEF